ncbi:2-acyl-glycerophospho-ethanolamine acyltransferase [Guptibacillus hwajinpoensis]|uniref:2-acyl-glycerophospho-ethanolamine acyltransferase n=1 Tax=Guptibacillus hwajinpoensis TaxID=208199 RepID=UPI0024B3739E|nr:2-acyl-glycerophospho-ethanolamine acyltransferase [Pseudalkalibacillus hwajinpoensis]
MARDSLNFFTKLSFFTGWVTISGVALFIANGIISDARASGIGSVLKYYVMFAFLCSLIGVPISIVSLFSKEKLGKRIFALIVNLSPLIVLTVGFIMEVVREFSEVPL